MHRGEVWWVDFNPAVGSEIRKTRPAVIVSDGEFNATQSRVVVVPFTSNTTRCFPTETVVSIKHIPSKAMVDQITAADKSRLKTKITRLSSADFMRIEEIIRRYLAL